MDLCTTLSSNRTGTGNITPGVQITAIIYSNGAVGCHLNKCDRTADKAIFGVNCTLRTANTKATVNDQICITGHIQCAISRRRSICLQLARLICINGIRSIKRNQECNTGRNSICTGRQGCIIGKNHHLTSGSCCCKIIEQLCIVHKIPRGILCKNCNQCSILIRNICKCRSFINNGIIRLIDPAQECATVLRGCSHRSAGRSNIHNGTGGNRRTINGNAAICTVILKSNFRGCLSLSNCKVINNQFIGCAILCGCDRNNNIITGLYNLAEGTTCTGHGSTIDHKLIDACCSPIKRDCCRIFKIVINGNCCGLGRCTKTHNSARALSCNGQGTAAKTIICCAANSYTKTCYRLIVTGSSSKNLQRNHNCKSHNYQSNR